MAQSVVRDIFDEHPSHLEDPFPLVLRPDVATRIVIYRGQHLGHSTKVPTGINTEQEIDRTGLVRLVEGSVQSLVA